MTVLNERGTVMVYILVAIGLFSALTYAISSGNRTNSSAITEQQAKLAAQEIIEFGNSVATAVQKLKLRGFADTEISFGNQVYQFNNGTDINTPGHNPNCTSDVCEIFSINGGSIEPLIVNMTVNNTEPTAWAPGHFGLVMKAITGIGSDDQYDLAIATTYLPRDLCLQINDFLGVDNPAGEPPSFDDAVNGNVFNGSYPTGGTVINVAEINGKTAFCMQRSSVAGLYIFYQVLIVR